MAEPTKQTNVFYAFDYAIDRLCNYRHIIELPVEEQYTVIKKIIDILHTGKLAFVDGYFKESEVDDWYLGRCK